MVLQMLFSSSTTSRRATLRSFVDFHSSAGIPHGTVGAAPPERQAETELGALAGLAGDPDAAAMGYHDLPRYGQSCARAAGARNAQVVVRIELIENLALPLAIDSRSRVADLDLDHVLEHLDARL